MRKQRGGDAKPKASSTAGGGGAAWRPEEGQQFHVIKTKEKSHICPWFFVLFENKLIFFISRR